MSTTEQNEQAPTEPKQPEVDMLSRSEAARYLGVHDDTIYRWSRKGLIDVVTLPSGVSRYRLSDLQRIKHGPYK